MARCPAHDDHTPSLSIRDAADGHVLLKCHTGCSQNAVIAVLRHRGLWGGAGAGHRIGPIVMPAPDEKEPARRANSAMRIWYASKRAAGTLAEAYLAARGLVLPGGI